MTTLDSQTLRTIVTEMNYTDKPAVNISKPILRAIIFELMRFIDQQPMKEAERVRLIQQLTMEHACMHICDLMLGLLDSGLEKFNLQDVVRFAVDEIEQFANSVRVEPEGNA